MKEIKIKQDDDGNITVESTDAEGNLIQDNLESIEDAIGMVSEKFGGMDGSGTELVDETGPVAAQKGGHTLEDNLPVIPPEKKGMMPKKKADWSDYAAM